MTIIAIIAGAAVVIVALFVYMQSSKPAPINVIYDLDHAIEMIPELKVSIEELDSMKQKEGAMHAQTTPEMRRAQSEISSGQRTVEFAL